MNIKYYTSNNSGEPMLSLWCSVNYALTFCEQKQKKTPSEQMCVLLNNSIVHQGFLKFFNMKSCIWCFGTPCEVWCKSNFSSMSYSHLFAYCPWWFLVDSVIIYFTFCCCLWSISPPRVNTTVVQYILLGNTKHNLLIYGRLHLFTLCAVSVHNDLNETCKQASFCCFIT